MEGLEQQVLLFIRQVFEFFQWPGVVLLMAIESACIPLPSEIIMPLSGWMLIKEQGLGPIYILWAGFSGALGCTIGSTVAYWVGKKGGRPFLQKYGKYFLVSSHDLERADHWFGKYGNSIAFLSRLLPVVRTFISLPAGIGRMPFVKFAVYTFAGSFPWCAGLAYGGYLLGEHWDKIRQVMRPFDIPILVILLGLLVFYLYKRLKPILATKPE